MLHYVTKIMLSAVIIVAVSELAKRHSTFAAVLASLPLTSLLAFVWLHLEGEPSERVAALSIQVFWLVLPSLVLFLLLPYLLRHGFGFWPSLALSIGATVAAYGGMIAALRRVALPI